MKKKEYKKKLINKKRDIENLKKKSKFSISAIHNKDKRIAHSISKAKKVKKIVKFGLINKKMSFGEIMNRYPEAAMILMDKGMHCMGCGAANFETLEQGALMHGINPDKLVEEINKFLGENKWNITKKF
jgi:hybrid cluster-associated redox disulfide protein